MSWKGSSTARSTAAIGTSGLNSKPRCFPRPKSPTMRMAPQMVETLGDVLTVLLVFVAGLLIWLAFSPFEMLGWWAGWSDDTIYWESPPEDEIAFPGEKKCYIVFFSGVGRATGETLSFRERDSCAASPRPTPRRMSLTTSFPMPSTISRSQAILCLRDRGGSHCAARQAASHSRVTSSIFAT